MDDVGLGGEDHVANPVEGKDTTEGTRGGVCGLAAEGQHLVDLGTKVDDRPTLCGMGGTHHMDLVT
jgi:hypothetical protein